MGQTRQPPEQSIKRLAELLAGARRPAALTGAGISAESGIPTFRSGDSGFWGRFSPQELATPQAFAADPLLVWCWYAWRRAQLAEVQPNAGHKALAELEHRPAGFTVITQNVDGLHQAAGSRNVIEVHGSITAVRCSAECTPRRYRLHERETDPTAATAFGTDREVAHLVAERGDEAFALIREGHAIPGGVPPLCPSCGAYLRPDVVWFGEELPIEAINRSYELAERADVFLAVGTSAVVYPAAGLPELAGTAGAVVVEINPEHTPLSDRSDLSIRSGAGAALGAALELLEQGPERS